MTVCVYFFSMFNNLNDLPSYFIFINVEDEMQPYSYIKSSLELQDKNYCVFLSLSRCWLSRSQVEHFWCDLNVTHCLTCLFVVYFYGSRNKRAVLKTDKQYLQCFPTNLPAGRHQLPAPNCCPRRRSGQGPAGCLHVEQHHRHRWGLG